MDREEKILKLMTDEEYMPMRAKELAIVLGVPKKEFLEFKEILNKLVDDFKVQVNRKSRYSVISEEKYIKGTFSRHEKGFGFVKIEGEEKEIYIPTNQTKSALHGDKVLIELTGVAKGRTTSEEPRPEGVIIRVLKREKDTLVGTFKNNRNFGFVIPDDKRYGTDIFIQKVNFNKAKDNYKVVVKITKYPEKGKSAEGKVVEVLGRINEAGIDMLSLVKEYSLPYEFPDEVMLEAQAIKEEIAKKDIPNRLDLRKVEIFTIDGEDAKDLDDAVCVERTKAGTYMLGVHIADVSYYVKENSELDKEAIKRGTSVYMLDRVIPMLPKELSNGICSLNSGRDRLTLSAIMEIDKSGKIISTDIQKSIINVTKRTSYSDITKLLEGKDKKILKGYEKYIGHFKLMEELALILKSRREKEGSLNLDIPESKIILDENGIAVDIKKYELSISNQIVEQFMLTANEAVAEKFFWLEAPFIYRVHEEPELDKIKELNKFLYNFGHKVKANKDNIHPKAFAEVLDNVKGTPEERVVSNLVLRTLKVARYERENKGHFGIASKYYCHFTSPIRRYPDLFVHRMISYYIDKKYNVKKEDLQKYDKQVAKYAESSSDREKTAQKVERDSVDIKKAEYMQDKIGKKYEGIVSSVTSFGMFVELENTVEGLIRFENMGEGYHIFDEERKILINERTKKSFSIGDKIDIEVMSADKETRRIDFKIAVRTK